MATRYSDLVRIEKHPGYYVNPRSKKITYRRTHKGVTIKIATGEVAIGKAKGFVEVELERRRTGASDKTIKRKRAGVVNPTIEDVWVDECLPQKSLGKSDNTRKNYHKSFKVGFGPFWAKKHCADLTRANMVAFKKWYLKTHPTRHVHHTLVHFAMLVDFIVKQGYAPMPDMSDLDDMEKLVEKSAKRPKVGRVFTDDEVKALMSSHLKLLESESGTPTPLQRLRAARLKLGIRLGLVGLRKVEALKLKRADVDFKNRMLKVWSTKNANWREVPMTDEIITAAREQMDLVQNSEFLFPLESDPTRHMSSQVFDKVWFEGRDAAGIVRRFRGDGRFHDLRHTFATWTAEQGWPPPVACLVLDMSLVIYSRVYAKPRFASKSEWMEKTHPRSGGES